jgi:ElaB/YqjD/DUF883 family membrane-anchored ribosome-binding protein
MSDTSSASKRAKAAANKATRELEARLESLRADMDEIMKTLAGKVDQKLDDAADALSDDPAESLLDELRDTLSQIKRYSNNAEQTVVDNTRDHPFQSLMIAFGIGFLVSIFLRR